MKWTNFAVFHSNHEKWIPLNSGKLIAAYFSELGKVANKMLYSPSSSVESERLFSVGGNILAHHNRIMPATGEELMLLLNFNLPIFNFNYKKLNRK